MTTGKYGESGNAFTGWTCPVCDVRVWRQIPDGPAYEPGGMQRHEHPSPSPDASLPSSPVEQTNYEAQEEVVSALWDFAAAQQRRHHNTREESSGTTLNLEAVGEALSRIMAAFGYAVERVE